MLEAIKTNQADGELKKIIKWLLGVVVIGGIAIFLFVPLHERLPTETELNKLLTEGEQKWQNQAVVHYELQVTQVNPSISGMLRVEVQDEKIVKVLEEMKIGKTLTPRMPLNKNNATVSYLFSLLGKRHSFYSLEAAKTSCKNIGVSIPTTTYDPKFGYPTDINSRSIDLMNNAENLLTILSPGCSYDDPDFSGEKYSNQLLIKLIPLN